MTILSTSKARSNFIKAKHTLPAELVMVLVPDEEIGSVGSRK